MLFPLNPERLMRQKILPLTSARSPHTPGGANDFYSEADYWWPNPDDPNGKYINRDGMSNPECFNRHRKLLMRMSWQVAGLTVAYLAEADREYPVRVERILRVWLLDGDTAMNPHLNYAQAIRNTCPGRCFGVIDTIHLAEVALSIRALRDLLPEEAVKQCRNWFEKYLAWLLDSPLSRTERGTLNNHAVCWYMQSAAFALLCDRTALLDEFRLDFKNILLEQIASDGSCPRELARTKPYGYSLFVLEAFAGLAALLTTPRENFFLTAGKNGQSVAKAMEFMAPFIADRSRWKLPPDVLYRQYWPSRQSSLYLAGHFLNRPEWLELYRKLPPTPAVFEVLRNLPIRHPQLWLTGK